MRAAWNPEDPYNDDWQNLLYEFSMSATDEKTFFSEDKDDEGRSPAMDVIELDSKMYSEIFLSGKAPEKPWFVAFVRKRRS